MSDHYIFGEDEELDSLRNDINFSKIIKKAQQIGNKSILRGKK